MECRGGGGSGCWEKVQGMQNYIYNANPPVSKLKISLYSDISETHNFVRNYSEQRICKAELAEMEKEQKLPEGGIMRDDGCVCPPPPPPPECKSKLPTCPYDPRFPNQNQTHHCYFSFIDYQRCARLLGDYPGCLIFYKCYTSLCPRSWWERWYDQMEKGTFPRKIYPPKPIIRPDAAKMRQMCYEDDPNTPPQTC